MGACASKPKDVNFNQASLPPAEGPTNPEPTVEDVQGEVAAEKSDNGVEETQKEEPLVDLSEPNESNPEAPKYDGDAPESKTTIAELVSGIEESSDVNHETAKQTEDKVEAGADDKTTEQTTDESHKSDVAGH